MATRDKLSESMLNRTTAINLIALESLVKPNTGIIVATTQILFVHYDYRQAESRK